MEQALTQTISPAMFADFVSWIDRTDSTTRAYLSSLKQFARWMDEIDTREPNRDHIILYRQYLQAKGLKPATVTAYLRSVKQFFSWTAAEGLYPNISETVRAPKVDHSTHKRDALEPDQVQQVERSIRATAETRAEAAAETIKDRAGRLQRSNEQGKRLYAMFLLAVNNGLRTIELHRANVGDLETIGGQSWIWIHGKGHAEADQRKPLAQEVAQAIRDYLDIRTDHPTAASPLFVSTGNRSGGKRIATTTISTMIKKALQEAGLDSPRLTAHSLRHTTGTATMDLTGSLYQTQKYMRHSNPATTEIYLHTQDERAEVGIVEQLYNYYHQGVASF